MLINIFLPSFPPMISERFYYLIIINILITLNHRPLSSFNSLPCSLQPKKQPNGKWEMQRRLPSCKREPAGPCLPLLLVSSSKVRLQTIRSFHILSYISLRRFLFSLFQCVWCFGLCFCVSVWVLLFFFVFICGENAFSFFDKEEYITFWKTERLARNLQEWKSR